MKNTAALVLALSLAGGTLVAQDATVRSLLSKDLVEVPERNSRSSPSSTRREVSIRCIRTTRRLWCTCWKGRS